MRVAFSMPIHAARARIGPHGPNHGTLIAKPSNHHVHVTLWVTPPTSSCPTLSADAELRDYLFHCMLFCVQLFALRALSRCKHDVGALFVVKCGNSRKSTHPLLWQTCKVLRPWVLFQETTANVNKPPETNLSITVRPAADNNRSH